MRPVQESDVYHAIAHPARRAILARLREGERSAGELAEPFRMSFPAISQHLRILEAAELVSARRKGRHRLYVLRPEPLQNVMVWVAEFRTYFNQRLDALGKYLDERHGREE